MTEVKRRSPFWLFTILLACWMLAVAGSLRADTAPDPSNTTVLLTIVGDATTSGETPATLKLTRADLESLPQVTFTTSTLWTEGKLTFSGPTLRSVLDRAGVPAGTTIEAVALNDYRVTFMPSDIDAALPIIATRIDGQPFDIRNRGPLWIVYPYDRGAEYATREKLALSIWQLISLRTSQD
ncbi:MAG: oxidoreductase [Limimaricola sp.]|uniref:oxidoreductase n=1 Tax=Limimaricola sp. TaxID=2211665 RepID=UPI001D40BA12|nr:oxidoreductase [Limimaricola sp.]MBI1416916.1 oxidoreductase [Limimaricola sp.]